MLVEGSLSCANMYLHPLYPCNALGIESKSGVRLGSQSALERRKHANVEWLENVGGVRR